MKTSTHKAILVSFATAAVLLGGCSTVNTVERASPQSRPNYVRDRRVIFDGWLAESLEVTGIAQTHVSGNLLKIDMEVMNLHRHHKDYRYRVEWIDKDGMPLPSPIDGWKTIYLEGRETAHVTATATSPKAVDFTIKFMFDHQ